MTLATSHLQRLVTGAALALLLTAGLALGGWVLVLLALVASSLALLEFYTMFWPCNDKLHMKAIGLVLGAGMLVAGHLDKPWLIVGCLAAAFLAGSLQFLGDWGRGDDESRFADGQILAAGLLYVPLLLLPVLHLSVRDQLLVALAAFISDTGAYYIGTYFGKARIWPRVSPKKSWAGSIGGLVLCIAMCVGLGLWWGERPWWQFAMLGVLLNAASQLGDFFESALKRTLGVKDSGTLLPGHGGLLDRIDSLLFVVPVYAAADSVLAFF